MEVKPSTGLQIVESIADLRQWRQQLGQKYGDNRPLLGFVPTMGALHEGHMALVRQAVSECQNVAVSIFVNPLQFSPGEDFEKYPRTWEKDMTSCKHAGVNVIFHPKPDEIYPEGQINTTMTVPPAVLTDHLCGAFRPGHFAGVATVVTKLFNLVAPSRTYFGEKDYQQLAVIKKMVRDFNLPLTIVGIPTVRESDGLAISSRNVNLSPQQRALAPTLYETLCHAAQQSRSKRMSLAQALDEGRKRLSSLPDVTLQYLEACDPLTLEVLKETRESMVILVAAKFGDVRLIDNLIVSAG